MRQIPAEVLDKSGGARASERRVGEKTAEHSADGHDIFGLQQGAGNQEVTSLLAENSGRPLDQGVREEMEARFGGDFADVRIHSNEAAGHAALTAGTRAVTTGHDIAFAPDFFAPQTSEGKLLLAHELAHVVQQGRGRGATDSSAEADARQAGAQAVGGQAAAVQAAASGGAQADRLRKEDIQKLIADNEASAANAKSREEADQLFRDRQELLAQLAEADSAPAAPQQHPPSAGVSPYWTPLAGGAPILAAGGTLIPGMPGPSGPVGPDVDPNAFEWSRIPAERPFQNPGATQAATEGPTEGAAEGATEAVAEETTADVVADVAAETAPEAVPELAAGGGAAAGGAILGGLALGFFGTLGLAYAIQHSSDLSKQPDPEEAHSPGGVPDVAGANPAAASSSTDLDAGAGGIQAPAQALPAPAVDPRGQQPVTLPSSEIPAPVLDPSTTPAAELPGQSTEEMQAAKDRRPTLRESTILQTWLNSKRAGKGVVRDPKSGEILEEPYYDKNGKLVIHWHMRHLEEHEWWRLRQMYEKKQLTWEQVIEQYNDPAHYQPESADENVSHEHQSNEPWTLHNGVVIRRRAPDPRRGRPIRRRP